MWARSPRCSPGAARSRRALRLLGLPCHSSALHWASGRAARWRHAAPARAALLLGLRRPPTYGSLVASPRRSRRSSRSSPGSTSGASRSAGWSRSTPSAAAIARWRPTTPRPSTAATRSRPAPTAGGARLRQRDRRRPSRTRTSRGRRLPAGRPVLPRPLAGPARDGGRGRRARSAFAASGWQWGGRWTGYPTTSTSPRLAVDGSRLTA